MHSRMIISDGNRLKTLPSEIGQLSTLERLYLGKRVSANAFALRFGMLHVVIEFWKISYTNASC